jgi:hypothetical protein
MSQAIRALRGATTVDVDVDEKAHLFDRAAALVDLRDDLLWH